MRRTRLLGLGIVGALAAAPQAFGQGFAEDRPAPRPLAPPAVVPAPPAPAPLSPPSAVVPASAYQPAAPSIQPTATGYQPAATGITPAAVEPAASPPHPWAVRPEHGAWFICAKSYTGPQAKELATEFAATVRDTHKAAAYLHEWGAEEKRKEELKRQLIRDRRRAEEAPFLAVRDQMRKKAEAEGYEFDATPPTIRVPHVEYQEQWAVLVGGFKDMDAARKALDTVRRWPAPEDKPHLLDRAAVAAAGQKESQSTFINPYATAMVFPNPSVRRGTPGQAPLVEPGLKRWNEKEELSLLNCKKGYTLLVKSFPVPSRPQSQDGDAGVFTQVFGSSKGGDMLQATAQQARTLAESLRHPGMKPQPFDSYVLHYKTGSLVTVGDFDGPDDPALIRTHQILAAMTFQVADEYKRPTGVQRMFDSVVPIAVPKVE